jgi:hypothetical protein
MGIKVYNTTLGGINFKTPTTLSDPYLQNVVLHIDSSLPQLSDKTGKIFTKYGTASSGNSGFNAAYFDANTYWEIDSIYDWGLSDFTFEYEIYHNATPTTGGIFGYRASSTDNFSVYYGWPTTGYHMILNDVELIGTTAVPPVGQFQHYAWCRKGNTLTLYIDGVLITTKSFTGSLTKNLPKMFLGWINFGSAFNGMIRNFTFTKSCRYLSNFTPSNLDRNQLNDPLWNSVVFHIPASGSNGSLLKNTKTNNTLVRHGTSAIINSIFTKNTVYANGGYYSTPGSIDFQFGRDDFTIEMWGYDLTRSAEAPWISTGWVNTNSWVIHPQHSSHNFSFWSQAYGTTNPIVKGPALPLREWVHVAISRQAGTTRLFNNGTLVATSTVNYNITNPTLLPFEIGHESPLTRTVNGWYADIRITKGVSRYNQSFTV